MHDPEFLKLQRTNPREADARLLFLPERQLVSLTMALEQIRRVHETAIDAKNEQISRQATYHLIWMLDHLTEKAGNDLFVRQLLRNLWQASDLANRTNDPSVDAAAVTWYFHTVFRKELDLSYLAILTEHFRQVGQDIIANDRWRLFTSMVSSLHNSILVPIDHTQELWDYEHEWVPFDVTQRLDQEHGTRRRVESLMRSAGEVALIEEYQEWLKEIAELDAILDAHISPEHRDEKDKLLVELKEFVAASLKFNVLREAIFALGAFAVMERRPNYIKYLWEYRQPGDADATWVGTDITPTNLREAVSFYFKKGYFGRNILVWKERHGSRVYLQRYFLLLLARFLQPVVESDGRYPELESFSLPVFDVGQLATWSPQRTNYSQWFRVSKTIPKCCRRSVSHRTRLRKYLIEICRSF